MIALPAPTAGILHAQFHLFYRAFYVCNSMRHTGAYSRRGALARGQSGHKKGDRLCCNVGRFPHPIHVVRKQHLFPQDRQNRAGSPSWYAARGYRNILSSPILLSIIGNTAMPATPLTVLTRAQQQDSHARRCRLMIRCHPEIPQIAYFCRPACAHVLNECLSFFSLKPFQSATPLITVQNEP